MFLSLIPVYRYIWNLSLCVLGLLCAFSTWSVIRWLFDLIFHSNASGWTISSWHFVSVWNGGPFMHRFGQQTFLCPLLALPNVLLQSRLVLSKWRGWPKKSGSVPSRGTCGCPNCTVWSRVTWTYQKLQSCIIEEGNAEPKSCLNQSLRSTVYGWTFTLTCPLIKDNKANYSKQTYNVFIFSFRGKMIPSDLERRIIEAKQKVSFCRELYPAHSKLRVHISVSTQWRTHFGILLVRLPKNQLPGFNENVEFCIQSIFISLSWKLCFGKVEFAE